MPELLEALDWTRPTCIHVLIAAAGQAEHEQNIVGSNHANYDFYFTKFDGGGAKQLKMPL